MPNNELAKGVKTISGSSKKAVTVTRNKAPSKQQSAKNGGKGRLKLTKGGNKDAKLLPALSNSLPPLKRPSPPQFEQTPTKEVSSKPEPATITSEQPVRPDPPPVVEGGLRPVRPDSPPVVVGGLRPVRPDPPPVVEGGLRPVRPDSPPVVEGGPHETNAMSDEEDPFSITNTESLMSSLTGLESNHPVASPEVSAASSRLSLTPSDETVVPSPVGGGHHDNSDEEDEEIEEVLSESGEDTMFEDPLHQSSGAVVHT